MNLLLFGESQMFRRKKLAIGIPTYKRPDFAIRLIKEIVKYNIYDQIIVSSNSKEKKLNSFILKINHFKITFNQQKRNVGLARNYFDVIKLCRCEYLHIISDEDSIYPDNVKLLIKNLNQYINASLIIVSVNDKTGKIYKDSSWQKNTYLKHSLGETAHIGSSIINTKMINYSLMKKLYKYADSKSSVYPTTAAALTAYSVSGNIHYFRKPIVKMGEKHHFAEIKGNPVYGFEARLNQYMALFELFIDIKLNKKLVIGYYALYYFTHHALQDSIRKFNEKPSRLFLDFYFTYQMNSSYKKLAYFILIVTFYLFYSYFGSRKFLSKIKKIIKNKSLNYS